MIEAAAPAAPTKAAAPVDTEVVPGPRRRAFTAEFKRQVLAEAATGPRQTRLEELAVICANCHRMVHVGGGCRALDDLIPG